MTDAEQLLAVKLDLLTVKLDTVLEKLAQRPTASAPAPIPYPKVNAALTRYGQGMPREVKIRMRAHAGMLLGEGRSEEEVASAIANGEGRERVDEIVGAA